MENKPKFCSECGAPLTGGAFCGKCGAKLQTTAVPQSAPTPAPAPAPAPAPVAAPTSAPENSLAAPKKLGMSVPALIIAIVALMTAGLAFLLQFVVFSRNYAFKIDFSLLGKYFGQRGIVRGLLTCGIVPIVAILVTIIKKKPVAIIGLLLGVVCMMFQMIVMLGYGTLVNGRAPMALLRFVSRLSLWTNGDAWLYNFWRNIRTGIKIPRAYLNANMFSGFFYWFKNILAILSCLLVVLKKKK